MLCPCAAHVGREHDSDSAVDVGVRKVVVSLLVSPLVGEHDPSVLELDEIRVHEHHHIVSDRGFRRILLKDETCVAPCLSVVFAASCIYVPAEMVVHEAQEQSPVTKSLDTRIVETLLHEVMSFYRGFSHYLMGGSVKTYPDSHLVRNMVAAAKDCNHKD